MPILLRRRSSASSVPPIPGRDRNWGEHFPAYRAYGLPLLSGISFLLGIAILFQILVQNWEIAAILMAFIDGNLLAAQYARQVECPHRFARILCAVYFATVRSARTGRAIRRQLRLPILFFFGFLMFFALRLRFAVGHDRPPLVDPRCLYVNTYWDYLRENNFFREPPPPVPPPDAP